MIKINLLKERTVRVRRLAAAPGGSRMGIALVVMFLAFVAAMATWWHMVGVDIENLTATRTRLQRDNERLKALRVQIGQFEKMKQQQQSRVDIVEKLKENQTEPVLLLSHVIRSIPPNSPLWLTILDQKADRIQIKGHTARSDVIPDFMTNLSAGGFFKSVDLEVLEEEKETAKFSLLCISNHKVVPK